MNDDMQVDLNDARAIGKSIGEYMTAISASQPKRTRAEYNQMIAEGDFVSFVSQDGNENFGRVEYVMTDGSFGSEGSKYNVPASSEDPVLLIRLFEEAPDGFEDQMGISTHMGTDGQLYVETELLTGSLSSNAILLEEYDPYLDNEEEDKEDESLIDESAISYPIPAAVKNNARSGLELRKKFGRGGTSVGENTARTLAAGGSIGIAKVRHIARYFPRHAGDNLDDKTSNGWIAWQLWGGHAARSWANASVAKADKEEAK